MRGAEQQEKGWAENVLACWPGEHGEMGQRERNIASAVEEGNVVVGT